ncbi:hypothetical protein IFM89_027780 [Coptis chinensis]|uniref:Uncharacterized protein n=1 Tax=Coptis chinensis TaxID=261450 RepID=A0A835LXI7_9MAGN|nr:hypothetical protein IFM89_027780 [Coptis chinensis]
MSGTVEEVRSLFFVTKKENTLKEEVLKLPKGEAKPKVVVSTLQHGGPSSGFAFGIWNCKIIFGFTLKGLLHTTIRDWWKGREFYIFVQVIDGDEATASWVQTYSLDGPLFQRDFAQVMIKLSSLQVLTRPLSQIRLNCSMVSSEGL